MSDSHSGYRWYKNPKLKNRYKTEIDTLRNGFGGDFQFIEQVNPDLVFGKIVIIGNLRYADNKWQHISIQFPHKYPYEAAYVFPINIINVGSQKRITPINFGKGNQYGDAKMCLFPRKSWDQNLGIGYLLRKAQAWLIHATSEKGFPKDKIVEELPMHIPHKGQVIMPKKFIPEPKEDWGMIHLTEFKKDHFIYSKNVLQEEVFSNSTGEVGFKWYRGPSGMNFKDFFKNSGAQEILKIFKHFEIDHLLTGVGNHNIAVYMQDDDVKWHFLRITISLQNGQSLNAHVSYYISKVVEEQLYVRIKDIFANDYLKEKKVTIVGLGALGSEVGVSLAKNGIGTIDVFDSDVFEIGNSIRHAANLFYIGERKTDVLKQLIKKVNPNIIVNQYHGNILEDSGNLEKSLETSDICIVLTGEKDVDYMINDIYTKKYSIPFIFSGVSIGAFSGGIELVSKDSACLRCLDLKGLNKLPKPAGNFKLNELGPEYGNCSGPALPGSEIDIKTVAMQVSRVILQVLMPESSKNYPSNKGSYFRWHGPYGSKEKKPFTWEIRSIKKDPNCSICNG